MGGESPECIVKGEMGGDNVARPLVLCYMPILIKSRQAWLVLYDYINQESPGLASVLCLYYSRVTRPGASSPRLFLHDVKIPLFHEDVITH